MNRLVYRIIPLVIIAFRKKDGGISGGSKKSVPKSKRFFDKRYKHQQAKLPADRDRRPAAGQKSPARIRERPFSETADRWTCGGP
jgi:hypothetical protein